MRDEPLVIPEMGSFGIFGASSAMQPVLRAIHEAAACGEAVLVSGEAGSGRARIARAIHALTPSRANGFFRVDCASARADLEKQLFGSERDRRGRKAGATAQPEYLSRESVLWRTFGGTLYLANIVEMPSPAQARLARLLRDREVIIPDGSRARVDFRPIAAVEPDFAASIDDGRFRRDLYARLSAVRIDLPPLRERTEDIPALAGFFLLEFSRRVGVPPKRVSAAASMLLQALPWRGNEWELRGLVESLAQSVSGDTIDLADVLASVRLDPQARSVATGGTLHAARQRFEREYIHAVLQQHQGRVSIAARALGIQRTNLYRKMRSLGITRRPAGRAPRLDNGSRR